MKTKKLFLLGTIDREDGGFLGKPVALEIRREIETFPDAVVHLNKTLSSPEFIKILHTSDYDCWLEEINSEEELELTLDDFTLESVEYTSGCCRWAFIGPDDRELVIDKSMDFATCIDPYHKDD